jgi:hypothetical protein
MEIMYINYDDHGRKKGGTHRREASAGSLALERRLIHTKREERRLTGGSRRRCSVVVLGPAVASAGAVKVVSIVQTLMGLRRE